MSEQPRRGNRGGLGKYLRARGRRGAGRPAQFTERQLLEGESRIPDEELDEEQRQERLDEQKKYSRRQLGTNADRYQENEPELDSDGEPIIEPEVDLTTFRQKQQLDNSGLDLAAAEALNEEDVDQSLSHIRTSAAGRTTDASSRKGKVETIAWSEDLDEMAREKVSAEANWDLKDRFRVKSERMKKQTTGPSAHNQRRGETKKPDAAPLLATESALQKTEKGQMEDFLDDLLG